MGLELFRCHYIVHKWNYYYLFLLFNNFSVHSMEAYFNVLSVLGLHEDILKLAADDVLGRKLQGLSLIRNKT